MAREFGRIRVSLADDEDFEELSIEAQWLFCRIAIPEPSVNHCGVFDWRPGRLLSKARGITADGLARAAGECEAGRFLLFDLGTEEALMRSYLRTEELLRNPKYGAAVVNSYRSIASKILKAAVADEVRRIKVEHPEYSSWRQPDLAEQLDRIADRKGLAEVGYVHAYSTSIGDAESVSISNGITNGIGNGKGNGISNQIGDQDTEAITNGIGDPIRSRFIETVDRDRASTGGNPSGVRNLGERETPIPPPKPDPAENDPPPRFCSRHPEGTPEPCDGCLQARKRHADHEARAARERSAAAKAARAEVQSQREQAEAARALEIVECGLCDDDGYRSGVVCNHRENSTPEAREAARKAVAAALSKGGDSK